MSGLSTLQEALPRWVRLERRTSQPVVTTKTSSGMVVTEVNAFPEAPPGAIRADVHFVLVAPTEGFPDKDELIDTVRGACGQGEFMSLSEKDLSSGPSYIQIGAWLGSQDLALMLIGAVELAGIAHAVTPERLGLEGETADQAAGVGLMMLGPSQCWLT